MISKEEGELFAECECGEREYAGTLEFHDFVEHLKNAGWKIRKEKDTWLHVCPECQE